MKVPTGKCRGTCKQIRATMLELANQATSTALTHSPATQPVPARPAN